MSPNPARSPLLRPAPTKYLQGDPLHRNESAIDLKPYLDCRQEISKTNWTLQITGDLVGDTIGNELSPTPAWTSLSRTWSQPFLSMTFAALSLRSSNSRYGSGLWRVFSWSNNSNLWATISTFLFILASAPRSILLIIFAVFFVDPILLCESKRTFFPAFNSLCPVSDRNKIRYKQPTFLWPFLLLHTVHTAGTSYEPSLGGLDIAFGALCNTWATCCIGNSQIARLSSSRLSLRKCLDSGASFYRSQKACLCWLEPSCSCKKNWSGVRQLRDVKCFAKWNWFSLISLHSLPQPVQHGDTHRVYIHNGLYSRHNKREHRLTTRKLMGKINFTGSAKPNHSIHFWA